MSRPFLARRSTGSSRMTSSSSNLEHRDDRNDADTAHDGLCRRKFRQNILERRESLSTHESNFLNLVAEMGTADEVERAQTILEDQQLFFDEPNIEAPVIKSDEDIVPDSHSSDVQKPDQTSPASIPSSTKVAAIKISAVPSSVVTEACSKRRMECLKRRKLHTSFHSTDVLWRVVRAGFKFKAGLIRSQNRRKDKLAIRKPAGGFVATLEPEPVVNTSVLPTNDGNDGTPTSRRSQLLSKVFQSMDISELESTLDTVDEKKSGTQQASQQLKRDEGSLGALFDPDTGMNNDPEGSAPRLPLKTRMASVGEGFEIDFFDLLDDNQHVNDKKDQSLDAQPQNGLNDPWSAPVTSLPTVSSMPTEMTHFRILGTSAEDASCKPHVLSPQTMESLQPHLPLSKRGESFWLRYSLVRDGASAFTFLRQVRGANHVLLAMETLDGEVFGAFTSSPWQVQHGHFGTGEAFVWKLQNPREFLEASSSSNNTKSANRMTVLEQLQNEIDVEVYRWTMENHSVQSCQKNRISVGGGTVSAPREIQLKKQHNQKQTTTSGGTANRAGDAKSEQETQLVMPNEWGFALCFENDNMMETTTSPCVTFQSPALSKRHADGSRCELINVEAWSLTPCLTVADAEILEGGKLFLRRNLTM